MAQCVAYAESMPEANLDEYQKHIAPLFAKNCIDCHGAKKSKGGIRIDQLNPDLLAGADIDHWVEIYDVLSQNEMPPDDEPDYHLKDEDRARIVEWLSTEMQKATEVRKNAATHSSFRRMANHEYNHALQDLLGLNLEFTESLPPENSSEDGFKNSSKFLQMSAAQLETYREISSKALKKATVTGEQPKPVIWQVSMQEAMDKTAAMKKARIQYKSPDNPGDLYNTHIVNKDTGEGYTYQWYYFDTLNDQVIYGVWSHEPESTVVPTPPVQNVVAVIPRSKSFHLELGNSVPDDGMLRVKIRVGTSESNADQTANLRLSFGFQTSNEGKMSARLSERDVEVTASSSDPEFLTFEVPLDVLPRNTFRKTGTMGEYPSTTEYLEIINTSTAPINLEIDYIEVEAGVYETWPPKSHSAIFFESPNQNNEDLYCQEILKRFMTRAWRRPIADEDIAAYHQLFKSYRPSFSSFQETMIEVLATVMTSPEFLYVVQSESETLTLSDLELANRLSLFLWSSIPDAELIDLAVAGKLKLPEILDSQIERMLADPKSQRFNKHFVRQWLGLEAMDTLVVDQFKFGGYNEAFQKTLIAEPHAFFDHILRNNRSVMDFIQSDYLVINEPLANHYGIPGVKGQEFRKVPIEPGANRGGLITSAAILTMTSTGVDSNPLKRGVWLLERMLHDPPPPPPPDVPEVDLTDPRILKMTPKERMADHRNQPACVSCHAKIDPWGISLENFDAIGRFRTTVNDQAVDATAVLHNDKELVGASGLKDYLMADRQQQFAKAMVHKMSTYALGRPMSFSDRAEIDKMATELRKRGDGLRDLISIVIHSDLFHQKIKQAGDHDEQ